MNHKELLENIYKNPLTFTNGCDNLYRKAKSIDSTITRAECMDFLKKQKTYQLHKTIKQTSVPNCHQNIKNPGQIWVANTIVMSPEYND